MTKSDLLPAFSRAMAALKAERFPSLMIACSGGPDSMALWDLAGRWASRRGKKIVVAHVHHGLRRGADRDARFVLAEARRRGAEVLVEHVDARARSAERKRGLEDGARAARYAALAAMAAAAGCPAVLAGHHEDDQAETVLLRLARGAGGRGLSAMAPESDWPVGPGPRLLRPLLAVPRKRIMEHLRARRLRFRTDETNASDAFARNRLRLALPALEAALPGFRRGLALSASLLREDDAFLESLARSAAAPRASGAPRSLVLKSFKTYHMALRRRVLRNMFPDLSGAARERFLAWIAEGAPGHCRVNRCWAVKERGRIVFMDGPPEAPPSVRLLIPGATQWGSWRIEARLLPRGPSIPRDPFSVWMDAGKAGTSLVVRSRRPGDRFKPLGASGSKKVQDVLVDAKIPVTRRNAVPVIEGREGILWLAGVRLADAAAVGPGTTRVLSLRAAVR